MSADVVNLEDVPVFREALTYLGENAQALAAIWERGRVAHVTFKAEGFQRDGIGYMPRKKEQRWAEACGAAEMRFVTGKAPKRVVLWVEGACLLLRLTSDGWETEPGSTDAEIVANLN